MWFIYESSLSKAELNADNYPVPGFCDAASAATFKGVNSYQEYVQFIAAKVDEAQISRMPDHLREDYDVAVAENRNAGDFVLNPHKLR